MEVENNDNFLEKAFKNLFGNKWGKILASIFVIILIFVSYLKGHTDGVNVSITNNVTTNPQTKGTETSNNPNPINFSDDIQNWNYSGYTTNTSEVCPTVFKTFSPIIWYKLPISMIFKTFSFTYVYPTNNDSPTYVIAIGQNPQLAKLYLHEQSPQLIGVTINQLNDNIPKFSRKDPLTLNEIPLPGSEITVTINPIQAGDHGITYNINVEYTPKIRPKDKTNDPFTITTMYFGNIKEAQTEIGFGSNNCITPLRYILTQ